MTKRYRGRPLRRFARDNPGCGFVALGLHANFYASRWIMTFDAQEIFANLAEKEKVKGHHSPEGRAITTLSRALSGWSAKNLSARDVSSAIKRSRTGLRRA